MNKEQFLAMSLQYENKQLTELEGEVFKEYKDNPYYMVSNFGRVKSIDKEVKHNFGGVAIKKSKILTQTDNGSGYLSVGLTNDGKTKNTRVSRMVAITFIDNKENKPQVNHIDGDKKNNNVINLEWATSGENVMHAWNNGLAKKQSSYIYIKERLDKINLYISNRVRVCTPIGFGTVIIDQNCYRVEYDNGEYENLIKSLRFWKDDFKLVLRSLSDLTKDEWIDRLNTFACELLDAAHVYDEKNIIGLNWMTQPFEIVMWLVKNHFNLMDESEPFIDVNTLP